MKVVKVAMIYPFELSHELRLGFKSPVEQRVFDQQLILTHTLMVGMRSSHVIPRIYQLNRTFYEIYTLHGCLIFSTPEKRFGRKISCWIFYFHHFHSRFIYLLFQVWIVYGDGACGYSLAEFDTFVRHKLPLIALVGNDAGWIQIARAQVPWFGSSVACDLNVSFMNKS